MNKAILALAAFCAVCFAAVDASAQLNTPTVADGQYLTPLEAPCIPYDIDQDTGTGEVIVRNSGPGYLSWVMLSTAPADASAFLVVRDTSVITGDPDPIGGRLYYQSTTANTLIEFKPPMRFTNGLTAQQSRSYDRATVCTRLYGTQVP